MTEPLRTSQELSARCTLESDARVCAHLAMSFARDAGLPRRSAWEVGISASELVANAVRHGAGGMFTVRLVAEPRRAVEIEVRDRGPGIPNLPDAMRDGHSRGRVLEPNARWSEGLGRGLGAVLRLMDETRFRSGPLDGTHVVSRKWLGQ